MNTPKIRFKGYVDDWEQRKLGEVGKARSGVGFPDAEQGGVKGIPFFKVSDMNTVGNESEMTIANNYVTEIQIASHKWRPVTEVPAIFFAKVGAAVMLNRKRLCRFPFLLDNNTMAYSLDKNFWDADFSKARFETVDLTSLIQVGALPSYNTGDVEKMEIYFPSLAEQKKIGTLFRQLDTLIILHQRKCEETKRIKKYMLQKMFPQDGANVPEIRFAGFTDAWEQRKLGEVADRLVRKNQDLESELPLTISAQYGLIDQNEFFDKRVASKDVSGYYLLKKGEYAYNKSTSNDAPWGAIKRLDKYEMGVVSTLYIVFKLHEDESIDSDFFATYYDTNLWHRDMRTISAEGARNHGLLNITPADFFDTTLKVPQDIEEQRRIGNFFTRLNTLITLHQQKLEKLKDFKKACLEMMFV